MYKIDIIDMYKIDIKYNICMQIKIKRAQYKHTLRVKQVSPACHTNQAYEDITFNTASHVKGNINRNKVVFLVELRAILKQ